MSDEQLNDLMLYATTLKSIFNSRIAQELEDLEYMKNRIISDTRFYALGFKMAPNTDVGLCIEALINNITATVLDAGECINMKQILFRAVKFIYKQLI